MLSAQKHHAALDLTDFNTAYELHEFIDEELQSDQIRLPVVIHANIVKMRDLFEDINYLDLPGPFGALQRFLEDNDPLDEDDENLMRCYHRKLLNLRDLLHAYLLSYPTPRLPGS